LEKNMSSERRTNRAVLGGIFIIIAALGIGRIITGNRLNNGFMPNILPLAVKEIDQTKEIPLSGLQTIDVSTISADIQVSRTSGGTILARLTGKAGNAPELTAYTEGTTGTIAVKWPKSTNNNTRSMNLELLIPQNYRNGLSFSTVSGDITLPGDAQFSQLSVKTVSGDIKGADSEYGPVKVVSVSGDAEFSRVSSANVEFSTTSGNLDYSGILDSLTVKTISGDLSISLDALTGPITSNTTSGDLTLRLPESASAAVAYSSASGTFSSELPMASSEPTTANSRKGTIGSGLYPLTGQSVSGDMAIQEKR
jgi:lia operon protein LiaG